MVHSVKPPHVGMWGFFVGALLALGSGAMVRDEGAGAGVKCAKAGKRQVVQQHRWYAGLGCERRLRAGCWLAAWSDGGSSARRLAAQILVPWLQFVLCHLYAVCLLRTSVYL